ncbi:MAG: SGNH/GDSL hydrolase family protein [Pseudolabrys sp.]
MRPKARNCSVRVLVAACRAGKSATTRSAEGRAMRIAKIIFFITTFVFAAHAADAKPFTHLWVFGDSTVDTGWYKVPKKNSDPPTYSGNSNFDAWLAPIPPDTQTGAQKWNIGKPTVNPKRISVQELAHILGVGARPHNQKNQANVPGTNYATSGARNKEVNAAGSGRFPNAIPTRTQIEHYLASYTPNGKALYVISSGGNDVQAALDANNAVCTDSAQSDSQTAANELANKINALQGQNAKYIIVANQPESFGGTDKEKCRGVYDTALKSKLDALGVSYAWGDVNSVRTMMEQHPTTFGLNPLYLGTGAPSCSPPASSTGIGSDWAFLCSPASPVSTPSNTDTSEFADNNHWAPTPQKVLGSYYYCLAKQTWPDVFTASPAPNQPFTACSTFDPSWN